MTPQEIARQILEVSFDTRTVLQKIEQALIDARQDALEEAAKVAEGYWRKGKWPDVYITVGDGIADVLRSMKADNEAK